MSAHRIMEILLACAGIALLLSFWRAHRSALIHFNAFDLVMENGRVSRIAVCFMVAFAVTTWVIVYLVLRDKLTEGYLTSYGLMWVGPLVARVVFNKTEPPTAEAPKP